MQHATYDAFAAEVERHLAQQYPDLHVHVWRLEPLARQEQWDLLQVDEPRLLRVDVRNADQTILFQINVEMGGDYDYGKREMERLVYDIGEYGMDALSNIRAGLSPRTEPSMRLIEWYNQQR